jgi:hypothetical protein
MEGVSRKDAKGTKGRVLFAQVLIYTVLWCQGALALPPPEDIPEEVLRTEIITEGRSPLDGQPLSVSEYEELQEKLAKSPYPPQLSPQLRQLIFLLRVRQMFKIIVPF